MPASNTVFCASFRIHTYPYGDDNQLEHRHMHSATGIDYTMSSSTASSPIQAPVAVNVETATESMCLTEASQNGGIVSKAELLSIFPLQRIRSHRSWCSHRDSTRRIHGSRYPQGAPLTFNETSGCFHVKNNHGKFNFVVIDSRQEWRSALVKSSTWKLGGF